jgi:formylglycine-generating enzyme required for sulfatase activity
MGNTDGGHYMKILSALTVMVVTTIVCGPALAQPAGPISHSRSDSVGSPAELQKGPAAGMTFVRIPAGSFVMGSTDDDSESPAHEVKIKSFYMLTTEVTRGMWTDVMKDSTFSDGVAELPVDLVAWDKATNWNHKSGAFTTSPEREWRAAQTYIQRLNKRYPGHGYRLPSEAEWEYACRAGTATEYNVDGLDLGGWYADNSDDQLHPVAQKTPNAWGIYDMHGNASEFCQDWYHDSYNGAPADGRAWIEPRGKYPIARGGSAGTDAFNCRSSNRHLSGTVWVNFIGFRLAAAH